MSKWFDNKERVKEVFDGIRNYLYCGILFYAGVENLSELNGDHKPLYQFLNLYLGLAFCLSSLYLFWVNTRLLYSSFVSSKRSIGSYIIASLIFFTIVFQFAIFALTHESGTIKFRDGTAIKDIKVSDITDD